MQGKSDNIILTKTFDFACAIVDLNTILIEKKQYAIANQVIKSGTSIGANVKEAQRGVSKPDFINKLGIALKEAEETRYWLDLIDAKITPISPELRGDITEIIKLLVSIINATKRNSGYVSEDLVLYGSSSNS